ncbi:MAG: NifB/NifX family molybdenum-iron cluster-binding protein [Deltaproteobacteria bacterium]|nr:NifB/NifX family molybdenum-iron cluster-binding protein [Deltaproteobacteria bacterium]MBW2015507.1 NifB/NifX family molybdenum-iron cluster-binding protein [Deltaproteobacteria bacterium]MBW2128744.1 NifB/NifX family molybdenum-iron cluster-binding protein [Deltaproteobacteria bacterium]MBW2303928.1 NifB/NifX family molybdenum-iron cluster-binding protein [Deltaproteobacteria bacterium]
MRIAITAQGMDLDSEMDPRFGRCARFLIVDTDTMNFEVLENTQVLDLPQGAGIQAAQNVIAQRPEAVLTGYCGPKAFKTLQAAGIPVFMGLKGRIRDVVKDHLEGKHQAASDANVEGHWV